MHRPVGGEAVYLGTGTGDDREVDARVRYQPDPVRLPAAQMTSCTASWMVMKQRVTSGWLTVVGGLGHLAEQVAGYQHGAPLGGQPAHQRADP